jgi:UDP-N-acetylglucosamine acyltransferase
VLGIHQFVHVGTLAMVGGMSRIERDVPPFCTVEGHPARVRALNKVGLQRSGLADCDGGEQLVALREAWRHLYRRGLPLAQALAELRAQPLAGPAEGLVAFLEASVAPGRRGPIPGAGGR